MSNEPVKRNWLAEAYKIFKGDETIHPKRQHVIATMEALVDFQTKTAKLRELMNYAYEEACKLRKEKGLPVPPPPPEFPIDSVKP